MLTIVIPTYNRHHCLNRIFEYYFNSGFKIIIADGSNHSLTKSQIQNLPESVTYYYEQTDPVTRMANILHFIKTPYACMLADDELHLSSALQESIRFLDTHHDYSSSIGLPLGFKSSKENHEIQTKLIYTEFLNHKVIQDSFYDRVNYHMSSYTPCSVYGVLRTETFKVAISCSNIKTSCVYAPEIAFELSNVVIGKLHIFEKISWLRSYDNPAISNKKWNRKLRFHDWFYDKKYQSEKEIWLNKLSDLLSPYTNIKSHELRSTILQAMNSYAKDLPQNTQNTSSRIISEIKNNLKSLLIKPRKSEEAFNGKNIEESKNDLIMAGNIADKIDFEQAFKIIKKF